VSDSNASPQHPLLHAGKWLLADFFSTLVFVGLYAATKNIFVATGLAIAAGIGRIVWLKSRQASVDAMQWLSLFLVVAFGGATIPPPGHGSPFAGVATL